MTATPLAMIEHHHSHADAQTGIQCHVIAMFGPSFFTGSLIARFGKPGIAAAGLLLIAASATVALAGTSLWHFWIALILLGAGWNFGFIASTAMVAELYRPEEAFRVQAMNEFILFSVVAIASFSSGGLLVASGWTVVNLLVYPIVAISVLLIVVPIEIISFLSRPLSHSLRLFGNILAGHIVLKVFGGMVVALLGAGAWGIASILPFGMAIALTGLEFLVAALQAFVFAVLTCVYLHDAMHPGH